MVIGWIEVMWGTIILLIFCTLLWSQAKLRGIDTIYKLYQEYRDKYDTLRLDYNENLKRAKAENWSETWDKAVNECRKIINADEYDFRIAEHKRENERLLEKVDALTKNVADLIDLNSDIAVVAAKKVIKGGK